MKVYIPVTLDVLGDNPIVPYITAKCGDHKSRVLVVSLTNNGVSVGIPENTIALLNCSKPDGTYTETVGVISNGKAEFELEAKTLSVPGDSMCELQLINSEDNSLLTTATIGLRVLPPVIPEDAVESSDEFPLLLKLIEATSDTKRRCEDAIDKIDEVVKKEVGEQCEVAMDKVKTAAYELFVSLRDTIDSEIEDFKKTTGKEIDKINNRITVEDNEVYVNEGDKKIHIARAGFTYGISIDLSNSNCEKAVAYTDEAIGMVAGSGDWFKMGIFKDIKPCLLKDGKVVGYLNPDNFAQFEDGTEADITSGNSGDVMIEIPKLGYRIAKSGATLTVQITNEPNKEGFSYKAHTRTVEGDRDKLYVGAFLGNLDTSGRLLSLAEKYPGISGTLDFCRKAAQANGSGYDLMSFYPRTLLQCLFLIFYKNLNCQAALGPGCVNWTSRRNTGATIDKGMNWAGTEAEQMKFLGIEDFWGNNNTWLDGIICTDDLHILTATDNFNGEAEGYTDLGKVATTKIEGYMKAPIGTNDAGFIIAEKGASSSTYFADHFSLVPGKFALTGGCYYNAKEGNVGIAGAFRMYFKASDTTSSGPYGARLMYL